ncbi:hypothetical protein CVT91_04460 [Candidatus Atribacteria bacterium HGW-Atribacteria-1]|nr:MAG: hypothetical protein CVT91_04460 [Candidatus Atribacteria bacterium HGW-Atribacteria-1]
MSAQLKLENVGGFKGIRSFEFGRGVVNEVEAPNAMGKTTLTRGLAGVLSMPITHDETINEARNQGLLRESLKNIYAKDARVRLQYNGQVEEWIMRSDGSISKIPSHGDERFIWAGMLTQETRSIRQLVEGNPDFSWVPRRLSYADRYATCKEVVNTRLSEMESTATAILRRQEGLTEENKKLQERKNEKIKLEKSRDEFAKQLDEKKRQHIERMKDLDRQLDSKSQKLIEYQAGIEKSKKEIKHFKARLESNVKNMLEIEQQIQEIDLEKIRKEVVQNVSQIDKEIAKLRLQMGVLNGKRTTFSDAKNILVQRGEREGICPVCEISTITVNFLEEKVSELELEIKKIEKNILALSSERTRWLQKEATERQRIDKYNNIKLNLTNERRDLTSKQSREERTLKGLEQTLEGLKRNQITLTEERTRLERETEDWEKESHEALKKIEMELGRTNKAIAEEMRKIQGDSFWEEEDGTRTSLMSAQERRKKYKSRLIEIREYFDQRQHEHEVQAIATFNNNVKKVMTELGFTEFDQIALDKDDKQLKVFRPGFVRQPLESLSTSEKYSIAVVLQITLKKTYLPDIPFFIVDEVVVNYDNERKERILDYLSQMAKEENLYVIVTKLAEKVGGEIQVKRR